MEKNFWCPDCETPSLKVKGNDGALVIMICVLCEEFFTPNSSGGFDRRKGVCTVCNIGRLWEREDRLKQCINCKSCFDENGKAIDDTPRTPSENRKIKTELERLEFTSHDDDPVAVPSPS